MTMVPDITQQRDFDIENWEASDFEAFELELNDAMEKTRDISEIYRRLGATESSDKSVVVQAVRLILRKL